MSRFVDLASGIIVALSKATKDKAKEPTDGGCHATNTAHDDRSHSDPGSGGPPTDLGTACARQAHTLARTGGQTEASSCHSGELRSHKKLTASADKVEGSAEDNCGHK